VENSAQVAGFLLSLRTHEKFTSASEVHIHTVFITSSRHIGIALCRHDDFIRGHATFNQVTGYGVISSEFDRLFIPPRTPLTDAN
jgi:hypothetical protein